MNTDQNFIVNNLKKMVKYITAETQKKVETINKEATKEANLEKALYIKPEKEKIEKRMAKELEDYKTHMKIVQSQKTNKLRLEKLKVKIDCVNSVFEDTKTQLTRRLKNNPKEYEKILKDLLVQGFIKLLDERINVICKKEDFQTVKGLLDEAKADFVAKIKGSAKKGYLLEKFEVTLDEKYFLPETMIGGVFMTSFRSKIRVDNTLDKRLELLKQGATPEIRNLLFEDGIVKKTK